jgi:hypothetical protein
MAEKIVPIVEKPNVPKKIINPNGNRNGNRFTLYKMVNIDSVNISIIAVKMNTTIIFARYIPHGLTGQRSKPGRVPLSRSAPKDRLNPIRPENMKATQRIPGMTPCRVLSPRAKAKLKMMRTRKEKRHIDRIISLVLSSDVRSFHTIALSF